MVFMELEKLMEKTGELHEEVSFEVISISNLSCCDFTDTSFELKPSILCNDDDEESPSPISDFGELFLDSIQFQHVAPLCDNGHCSSPCSLEKELFNDAVFCIQEHCFSDSSVISTHPDVASVTTLDEDQNNLSSSEFPSTFYCASFSDSRTSQLDSKSSVVHPNSQVISEEPISSTVCATYFLTEDTVKKPLSMSNKSVVLEPSIAEHCCRQEGNLPPTGKICEGNVLHHMKQFSEEMIKYPKRAAISTQDAEPYFHEIYSFENLGSSSVLNVPNSFQVSSITKDVWNWLCQNEFLQKVAEKAKSSLCTVITTLDPEMRNVFKPPIQIMALTMDQDEAFVINRAFQKKFSMKICLHAMCVSLGNIPPQPVGFKSGLYCAEAKIRFIRQQKLVSWNDIVVATSPLIVETTPNRWHYCTCIMLDDPMIALTLHNFTQLVPVPNEYVHLAQARTPDSYHLKDLGLHVTIGQIFNEVSNIKECDWQYATSGTSYYDVLELAATLLAGMYRGYATGVYY